MSAAKSSPVLVTGGRGFLGRALVRLLLRSTDNVVSLDQAPIPPGCTDGGEIMCDIADAAQLRRVFEAQEIRGIVHLAAILPTAAQHAPVRATQVNVAGSMNLLEMAREFDVRRFVFASSVSVYGTCPMNEVVSEEACGAPEDLYGAAKVYVEQLGQAYSECHGLEFISLRIARVVGPGARSATSAWRSQIFELLGARDEAEIELPYEASERLLVLHVDDVAKMLVRLLQAPRVQHSVYNAPCESVIVGELKREVEALNPKINVKLGERYAVGNPRLLDCSRFQKEFNFRAIPIFEQLRRAAAEGARGTSVENGSATI